MHALHELQVQYITNDAGKRSAVVIPIEQFNQLLEDVSDLAVIAERREEPVISHSQLKQQSSPGLMMELGVLRAEIDWSWQTDKTAVELID